MFQRFGVESIPKVFQLFDLVETSAKVFANIIDKPNEPMMYPKPDFGKVSRNPFCEEKLIHVNFVKINQKTLDNVKKCQEIDVENLSGQAEDSSIQTKAGRNDG